MTNEEVLWQDDQFGQVISRSTKPSDQTLALLKAAVWGSRETRYRVLGIAEKLARLRDPSFFVLSENGTEICVFVMDHCHKDVAGTRCGGYHFVMAATLENRRDEGFATRLIEVIRPYAEQTVGRLGFGFAYIEETTEITLKISEHIGHSIEADIPLQLFSRLMPRRDERAGQIRESELQPVVQGLERLYANHELADFHSSIKPEETYVYHRNDRVTASVQAELLNWEIVSMPGLFGRLLLDVMPWLPGWNNILNLKDLKVLRFGNIFFEEDLTADLFSLAEACLAANGSRVGLIMLDSKSNVLQTLRSYGKFGLLSRALKGNVKLHIEAANMSEHLLSRLKERPLLVSPSDVF